MHIPILRDDAIRIFFRRGVTMWILVRLLFLAVTFGSPNVVPPPVGVVLLAALLSVSDWRGRTERAFWRNYGVGLRLMITVALAAGVFAEILLAFAVRYGLPHR
jgi:hypothetical protein